jgi:hypothetical protein
MDSAFFMFALLKLCKMFECLLCSFMALLCNLYCYTTSILKGLGPEMKCDVYIGLFPFFLYSSLLGTF